VYVSKASTMISIGKCDMFVLTLSFSGRTSSIERNVKLKDRASFFSFFLEPLYEICLIRIKEQVGEKMSTICTYRYADCLLKNTCTKHSKYVVIQKLEPVEDISFRELFGRIREAFYTIRSVKGVLCDIITLHRQY
jgi:hypothetical protein